MESSRDHLDAVGAVVTDLAALGLEPVMVGGMALVVLGSRRVTRDFDFVIPTPAERLRDLVDLLYDRGFELISRLTDEGDVAATITSRAVALSRLRIDAPPAAYFYDPAGGLRIDLLFDFPIAAASLLTRAIPTTVGRHVIKVSSEEDLLVLKRLAASDRHAPGDAEDIAFLERRRTIPPP